MQVDAAFNQVLVMMLMVLMGVGMRKVHVLEDVVIAKINRLLVLTAQPALCITCMQYDYTPQTLSNYFWILGLSIAVMVIPMLIIYGLTGKKYPFRKTVLSTASVLGNVGFMGIPVAQAALGSEAAFYMSACIVAGNIATWMVGCALYEGLRLSTLKDMINPITLAIALGLVLFLCRIRLSGVVLGALQQVSALNTPMAMMVLGARMANLRLKDLKDMHLWSAASFKLIGQPLLIMGVLLLLKPHPMVTSVMVLSCAMPCGSNVQLLTELNKGDISLSARCVSVSSLLSALTIPLMLTLGSMVM